MTQDSTELREILNRFLLHPGSARGITIGEADKQIHALYADEKEKDKVRWLEAGKVLGAKEERIVIAKRLRGCMEHSVKFGSVDSDIYYLGKIYQMDIEALEKGQALKGES